MNPFKKVPQQIAANPVARAIANKHLSDAVRTFQTKLYVMQDGEDCADDAKAAMQVCLVCAEACAITEKLDSPECRVMRGAISCLVQVADRGFTWRQADAVCIDTALTKAVEIYKSMKASVINQAWARVQAAKRRVDEEAMA